MIKIDKNRLNRLHSYLIYLKYLKKRSRDYVSTQKLAKEFNLKTNIVRSDLEFIDDIYSALEIHKTSNLFEDLEKTIGCVHPFDAVIVGDPDSIKAASESHEIKERGITILACFTNENNIGFTDGIQYELLPIHKLEEMIDRMDIKMAVVAASHENEQYYLDKLSATSVKSIIKFGINQSQGIENILLEKITS